MSIQVGWGWARATSWLVPGSHLQTKPVLQLHQVHPVVQGGDIMPFLLGDCGLRGEQGSHRVALGT